jgi:hypothetical protein
MEGSLRVRPKQLLPSGPQAAPQLAAEALFVNDLSRTTATDFAALQAQQRLAARARAAAAQDEAAAVSATEAAVAAAEQIELLAREAQRARTEGVTAYWDGQVARKPLRAEFALSDPTAIKRELPPRDLRPIWESNDEGHLHNAQTFAKAERAMDPRLAAAKKLQVRAGLGQQVLEGFTKRLADAEDAAATAWASDVVRTSLDALEAGAGSQRRSLALLNASDNRALAAAKRQERAEAKAQEEALDRRLDEARRTWGQPAAAAAAAATATAAAAAHGAGEAGGSGAAAAPPAVDYLGEMTRRGVALREELRGEVLRKEREKLELRKTRDAWAGAIQSVDAAAGAMALEAELTRVARTRAHFDEVRVAADERSMQRAADKIAAKVAQEPAEYGLLAKFGANARRVPSGTRA